MIRITEKDIGRKGFSVLYGKWLGAKNPRALIGLRPDESGMHKIGYLAYPNVGLKNVIPREKFFNYSELQKQNKIPIFDMVFKTSGKLEQSVGKSEYMKNICEIKELLARGEIYQMCYCIRFRKRFEGSPYALFQKLISENPSDFSAFINCGNFQIISNSPEGFFKVRNGLITTTPIKGTVSKQGGKKNLTYLINSEKERAELDMITDLERNDIGKICEYGTLKLKNEREIIELKNLWHAYSEVEGKLRSDIGVQDILDAMFPGGSITGCPKKRAMEYIGKLEVLPRNIFTGSIGYISMTNDQIPMTKVPNIQSAKSPNYQKIKMPNNQNAKLEMDFNIAIRTALVKDGWVEFWAGSGIVADSEPEKEYEECCLKAERFLDIIKSK